MQQGFKQNHCFYFQTRFNPNCCNIKQKPFFLPQFINKGCKLCPSLSQVLSLHSSVRLPTLKRPAGQGQIRGEASVGRTPKTNTQRLKIIVEILTKNTLINKMMTLNRKWTIYNIFITTIEHH